MDQFGWQWMRRALELAEQGRGRVEPNPRVGAVVVRDGRAFDSWMIRYKGRVLCVREGVAQVYRRVDGGRLYRWDGEARGFPWYQWVPDGAEQPPRTPSR
jgi:hypothetical protein